MTTSDVIQRNDIGGKGKTIREILFARKFYIDYYQREYKWQTKQLEELLNDLSNVFLGDYDPSHERRAVASYNHYFLGSIIISQKNGRDYVIDGQQRLTTLTLLLLYLMKRQEALGQTSALGEMIFSEEYGEKSFNIDVPERRAVMQAMYDGTTVEEEGLNESSRNIIARFNEIEDLFPTDDINDQALPYFVDWLTKNVHIVEITAYSDDVAYTIFETMNDRGLSLSPTDMLKGYLLANITDEGDRTRASASWRAAMLKLRDIADEQEADFFKAWFRARYAQTIRERKRSAAPGEWDRIGTEFHRWVRNQAERINLKGSPQFRDFILKEMHFFHKWYLVIRRAEQKMTPGLEHLYFNASFQFTHQPALLLASLGQDDDDATVRRKLSLVARFADILLTRRMCNFREISYRNMQYPVFRAVQRTRGLALTSLGAALVELLEEQPERLNGFDRLYLNQWSHRKIKRILARITDYVETQSGGESRYEEYISLRGKKAFEVEHVLANRPERHREEFETQHDFSEWRNRLGALLLLPKPFNASYRDKAYPDKLEHYFGQNLLAKSLHPIAYEHHPGFRRFVETTGVHLGPHKAFDRQAIESRQKAFREIAERIWDPAQLQAEDQA